MPPITANPTYLPEGPDYHNYSFFNGQQGMPEMGGASSPVYRSLFDRSDFMARPNHFAGNSAFATPGGMNFGSPSMNMLGNMAIKMLTGGAELAPMMAPDMSAFDYMRSRQRYDISRQMLPEILGQDKAMYNRLPGAFQNQAVQMFTDQFNPGGSQQRAFETIYGRFGTDFGGTMQEQAGRSMEMLKQLNQEFEIKSGPRAGSRDFNRSYGFDRVEMADLMDSAARYGVGGMSMEKITEASEKGDGSLGKMARDTSKVFSIAKDLFGKDKGFDELSKIMTQSIAGFEGLDPGKAAQLLQKIESASRAVNISGQAFSQYTQMFTQMYSDRNIGGSAQIGNMTEAAMQAKVSASLGREHGDMVTSDQNRMMGVGAEMHAKAMNSPMFNKATALGLTLSELTDSQKAAIQVNGIGNMQDVEREFQKALASGDTQTMNDLMNNVRNGIQPNEVGLTGSDLIMRSRNLSMEDREKFARLNPGAAMNPQKFQQNRFMNRLATSVAGRMTDEQKAALGPGGIRDLLSEFTSAEMADPAQMRKKLAELPQFAGMSEEQRDNIATAINLGVKNVFDNPNALGSSFGSVNDKVGAARKTIDELSKPGMARMKLAKEREGRDALRSEFLREVTGDTMRGSSMSKIAGVIMNHADEINDWWEKGAKLEDLGTVAKNIGLDAAGADQLGKVVSAMQGKDGEMESAIASAQRVYDFAKDNGESDEDAAAARSNYIGGVTEQMREAFNKTHEAQAAKAKAADPGKDKKGSESGSSVGSDEDIHHIRVGIEKMVSELGTLLGKLGSILPKAASK